MSIHFSIVIYVIFIICVGHRGFDIVKVEYVEIFVRTNEINPMFLNWFKTLFYGFCIICMLWLVKLSFVWIHVYTNNNFIMLFTNLILDYLEQKVAMEVYSAYVNILNEGIKFSFIFRLSHFSKFYIRIPISKVLMVWHQKFYLSHIKRLFVIIFNVIMLNVLRLIKQLVFVLQNEIKTSYCLIYTRSWCKFYKCEYELL